MQFWRLDCGSQTLLLGGGNDLAEVFYWGARLPDAEHPQTIWAATRLDYSGGVLDGVPSLSSVLKFPKPLRGIPECAFAPQRVNGLSRDFFTNAEQSPDALILDYTDKAHGLSYQARFLTCRN